MLNGISLWAAQRAYQATVAAGHRFRYTLWGVISSYHWTVRGIVNGSQGSGHSKNPQPQWLVSASPISFSLPFSRFDPSSRDIWYKPFCFIYSIMAAGMRNRTERPRRKNSRTFVEETSFWTSWGIG